MRLLIGHQALDFLAPAVLASGVLVDRVHLHIAATTNTRYGSSIL